VSSTVRPTVRRGCKALSRRRPVRCLHGLPVRGSILGSWRLWPGEAEQVGVGPGRRRLDSRVGDATVASITRIISVRGPLADAADRAGPAFPTRQPEQSHACTSRAGTAGCMRSTDTPGLSASGPGPGKRHLLRIRVVWSVVPRGSRLLVRVQRAVWPRRPRPSHRGWVRVYYPAKVQDHMLV
jgi:hypothetical protein